MSKTAAEAAGESWEQKVIRLQGERDSAIAALAAFRVQAKDACHLESVSSDETDGVLCEEDQAYNRGIRDCIDAIHDLPIPPEAEELVRDADRYQYYTKILFSTHHEFPNSFRDAESKVQLDAAIDKEIQEQPHD